MMMPHFPKALDRPQAVGTPENEAAVERLRKHAIDSRPAAVRSDPRTTIQHGPKFHALGRR